MAPRADNPYTGEMPAPSGGVAQDGSGASSMQIDATPEAFGAPVARGVGVFGSEVEKDAQKLTGMVLETSANQAELDSVKATAPVIAKYKSLEGLAAYAAAPQFEKDVLGINQKIRDGLPLGAQRMFDSTTARQSAYMIRDYQTYAAGQVKRATLDSTKALAETASSRAGDVNVAADDFQFGNVVGDIKHSVASMMDLQGYSEGVTTDPKTGKTTFANTPEGQQAKIVYQSELDKLLGSAWENRIEALANHNVANANKVFEANKDNIPGIAQVKIGAFLNPKTRDYEARNIVDNVLAKHIQQYQDSITNKGTAGVDIAAGSVPSQADYYRTNYNNIVDEVRTQSQAQHPDDPNFTDNAVAKVEQRTSADIKGQEFADKADGDLVMRAYNGEFNKGSRPLTVDQLSASNPEVAAAWRRMKVNNPEAVAAIENKILTANAKGKYNASNPVGYTDTQRRIFLPKSDPQAIIEESQLWPLVANNTITGKDRDELAKMLNNIQNPQSKVEAAQKKEVTDAAMNQIIPAVSRRQGVLDPDIESRMTNARLAIDQADAEAIKAGKTAQQRYSPDSKDFVGNAAKSFLLTPAQRLEQGQKALSTPIVDDPNTVKDLTSRLNSKQATLSDLQTAVKDRKMTKATAIKLASEHNLIRVAQPAPSGEPAEAGQQ